MVLGIIVMTLGVVQVFFALIRPPQPELYEDKGMWRTAWEIIHKYKGYGLVLAAVVTVFIGLHEIKKMDGLGYSSWMIGYVCFLVTLGALALGLRLGILFWGARDEI